MPSTTRRGRFPVAAVAGLLLAGPSSVALIAADSPAQAAPPRTYTLVDVAPDGTPANSFSRTEELSANGRYVVFTSDATNLVPDDTNEWQDVFVRDVVAGTTTLVSGGLDGPPSNYYSSGGGISANGRYVVFVSAASNIVAGDTNGQFDVFVRDLWKGVTKRVGVSTDGGQFDQTIGTTISADGRYVAFTGLRNLPVDGPDSGTVAYVRDIVAGTTTRVSLPADDKFNHDVYHAIISANGKVVSYYSAGDMIGDGHGPGFFVRDLRTGRVTRASVSESGEQAGWSSEPNLSADGTKFAFIAEAPLIAADTNGYSDVYVRDLTAGTTTLVSATRTGAAGNRNSFDVDISGDGRYVAFRSYSTDLVDADTNESFDVFVRDLVTGRTRLVSTTTSGATAKGPSTWPQLSQHGNVVAFNSLADLTPAPPSERGRILLRCLRNC